MGKHYRKNPHFTIYGKEKVPLSRVEAVEAARNLHKTAYRCPKCEWYHIGSDSKAVVAKKKQQLRIELNDELGVRVATALGEENLGTTKQRLEYVTGKARSAASRRMDNLTKV